MTTTSDTGRSRVDRTIADWLVSRVPDPPPPDLFVKVVASTRDLSPRPTWLAGLCGHHLDPQVSQTGDRSRWLLVLALVGLGAGIATLTVGREFDIDRPAIIPPVPTAITPAPSPTSAEARPSPKGGGLVMYSNVENDYELLVPERWIGNGEPRAIFNGFRYPGVKWFGRVGPGQDQPTLTISVGGLDGSLVLCRPVCESIHVYTIPGIEDALVSTPSWYLESCSPTNSCTEETRGETTLGGLPARFEGFATAGGGMYHVFTIRDGRPIVLTFDYWSIGLDLASAAYANDFGPGVRDTMLASFRFLDQASALVPYRNVEDGYELSMPARWIGGTAPQIPALFARTYPGVRWFGEGGAGGGVPALTISVGGADGSVTVCQLDCRTIVVDTIDELMAAVDSTPDAFLKYCTMSGQCREHRGDLSLDGVPARTEEFATHHEGHASNCLGCSGALYQVLAIRDGRPIVLAFDYWNIAFERTNQDSEGDFGPNARDQMIASFRFLD